ncbi:hypothetical protein EYC84_008222 [Monilinia fructicola]|uniref:Uncharacterized protein n=1 Tax=Monilinia fructicola TaxID=38448 RepID=A0A5M9JEG1_MONFR|nr:hypothetical protein EYC84_008222 [Monilinia fructicola]
MAFSGDGVVLGCDFVMNMAKFVNCRESRVVANKEDGSEMESDNYWIICYAVALQNNKIFEDVRESQKAWALLRP